eukprot:5912685-Pyramimonas_sp.AAC.1
MESGIVEETLDDLAEGMVQYAVVLRFARHPACACRWGTCVAPQFVPHFRLFRHLPQPVTLFADV